MGAGDTEQEVRIVTVEELIKQLSQLDPQTPVIISRDAEGNEYSAADSLDIVYLEPDWDGGRTEDVVFDEDIEEAPDDYNERDWYVKAAALWPI